MVAKALSDNLTKIGKETFLEVMRMTTSLPLVKEALICTFRPDSITPDKLLTDGK
jgi:hypothetical protein